MIKEVKDEKIQLGRVKTILGLAFILGFIVSYRLWISERSFPLVPAFDWLPQIPIPLDKFLFFGLLLLLGSILFSKRPKWSLTLFLVLSLLLALLDQTRWQPWFYQYFFMGVALCCYYFRLNPVASLHACRLIVVSIYFWSGVQKINYSFLSEVFPWLMEPIIGIRETSSLMLGMSCLVPICEIGMALSLLTARFRRIGVAGSLFMHISLLCLLGPLGHNWNSVIWPWNLAMMAFVVVLFGKERSLSWKNILIPRSQLQLIILILFVVMPAFSFSNYWDSYPSFKLYSGNAPEAYLVTPTERVSFQSLAIAELNVPPYPEPRVFQEIWKRLCEKLPRQARYGILIYGNPNPFTGVRELLRSFSHCRE